ncbi:MAG: serine hydrolase domain-containing protein [Candidatus Odinarchaeota archaeon]
MKTYSGNHGLNNPDIRTKLTQHQLGNAVLELLDHMAQSDYEWLDKSLQSHFVGPKDEITEVRIKHLKFFFKFNYQEEIKLVNISKFSENALIVDCRGSFNELAFSVEITSSTGDPGKLTGIRVTFSKLQGITRTGPRRSSEEVLKELGQYLDTLEKRDLFSGGVLLAKDGIPVFTKVAGDACKRYRIRNEIDTKFNLGSMNKMFTSVAIMQLFEQGKLDVNDTVSKYLPDFPGADKITIHQLLTHTSGLGSYWNRKFEESWAKIRTVDDYLELFVRDPLLFPPGERTEYSNAGYIVLGKIIEVITGMTYYDYVKEFIYKPAGMVNTDAFELDKEIDNLAIGYTYYNQLDEFDPAVQRNNFFQHCIKGGPAGGGYSTLEDLLNFASALQEHKLISKENLDMATLSRFDLCESDYGYGFQVGTVNGIAYYGHGGGAPGIGTNLLIFPEAGFTLVILTNYDPLYSVIAEKKLLNILQELV